MSELVARTRAGRCGAPSRETWRQPTGIALVTWRRYSFRCTTTTTPTSTARQRLRFRDPGLGLNIVVGFAGLLDLGYAAFFAIGAYTYGF